MNRLLKERMIGAAVLVAIAIILIPEMLSGPRSSDPAADAGSVSAENSKLKTYTIDLTKAASPTAHVEPPSSTPTIAETPVAPPPTAVEEKSTAPSAANGVTSSEKSAEPPKPETRSTAEPVTKTAPIKKETEPAPAQRGGWTIQVGSFGVRATSDRVAEDLKRAGFPAFVVAFQAGAQTMYRVRVGPVRDRPTAEELLRKIKSQHPNAAVIPPA